MTRMNDEYDRADAHLRLLLVWKTHDVLFSWFYAGTTRNEGQGSGLVTGPRAVFLFGREERMQAGTRFSLN